MPFERPAGVAEATAPQPIALAPLERRLVKGTRVAVTLEPSGDVVSPSRPLRLSTVWE